MANIVLRSAFDLMKGVKSEMFDVPSFNISAISIAADGKVADALEDDPVFHQQMVDAVNDRIDEARAEADMIIAKKTREFSACGEKPGDIAKKTNDLEGIQDACAAELEEVAKALPAELAKSLQKAFDAHNSRAKLGLKYKVTVAVKATVGVLSMAAAGMRLFLTAGADLTAYLVIVRQQLAIIDLVVENLKSAEKVEAELIDTVEKLYDTLEAEYNKEAKALGNKVASVLVAILPFLQSKVPLVRTALTKAQLLNTKLVAIDSSCKKLLTEVEKDMKELEKEKKKGAKDDVLKNLEAKSTSKLDQIGKLQLGLKTKWKNQEAATQILEVWNAERFTVVKLGFGASQLAGAAGTLYSLVTESIKLAAAVS
jgi:hypothetical protein